MTAKISQEQLEQLQIAMSKLQKEAEEYKEVMKLKDAEIKMTKTDLQRTRAECESNSETRIVP